MHFLGTWYNALEAQNSGPASISHGYQELTQNAVQVAIESNSEVCRGESRTSEMRMLHLQVLWETEVAHLGFLAI